MHFERRSQPIISRRRFVGRMFKSLLITLAIATVSLALGTVGYCHFGHLDFLDGLLNASMILTGMGPVDAMKSSGGKLFASFYALYSGIAFLSIMAVITAPIFHRILHRFHIEEDAADERKEDQDDKDDDGNDEKPSGSPAPKKASPPKHRK